MPLLSAEPFDSQNTLNPGNRNQKKRYNSNEKPDGEIEEIFLAVHVDANRKHKPSVYNRSTRLIFAVLLNGGEIDEIPLQ